MAYDVRGATVKNTTLLNISWSDGDMQAGAGTRRDIFTPEQKSKLTFNKHKWLGGEVVVSYDGEIIYITLNGLKTNHTTALNIRDAIATGYTQDKALLED